MFKSAQDLIEICEKENISISEAVLLRDASDEKEREELISRSEKIIDIMLSSATKGIEKEVYSLSGIIGGNGKKLFDYAKKGDTLSGNNIVSAMAMALSVSEVNAAMGKIVAAPTAGAAGIMPAILKSAHENLGFDRKTLVTGLLNSGAIGAIVARNASVAGAVGGCQAETGTAAAMGASALVEMKGGTIYQCLDAASFAIVSILGLVCDPIAGLVEYPCELRNASGVHNAYASADMALAGMKSLVPFDEVVEAMRNIGNIMSHTLKETALGGLAATPTGCRIKSKLFGD